MARFIMLYVGGDQPETPEQGQAHFAKYKRWLESLGEACISPANPFKNTHAIDANGDISNGSSLALSGYTLLEADSIETVLSWAQSCPFLELNGRLEVSELVDMKM